MVYFTVNSKIYKGVRCDGGFVTVKGNGKTPRGTFFSEDEANVKELKLGRVERVITSRSNADVPEGDKDCEVKRLEKLQPFIGCIVKLRPAHYASGKQVYRAPEIGGYLTENEVEIVEDEEREEFLTPNGP